MSARHRMVGGEQLDLLDVLDALVPEPEEALRVHVLMPSMVMACGLGFLDAARRSGGQRPWVFVAERGATCPDCLAVADLAAVARAMQTRQA